MIQRTFTVKNPSGLHLRPAGVLAEGVGRYESDISIIFNEKEYNAKSVISVMSAGIYKDSVIDVRADGADEAQAMETVSALIQSGLGE